MFPLPERLIIRSISGFAARSIFFSEHYQRARELYNRRSRLDARTINAKHRCSPASRLPTAREGNTTLAGHPVELSRITGLKVRQAVNNSRILRRNDEEVSKLR